MFDRDSRKATVKKYLLRTFVLGASAALIATPAWAAIATPPPTRNLLTTEFHNNVPSITLRGAQLSPVATSILPLESIIYYQTIGGFFIASVAPIVGSAFDSAKCSVTFSHALCTDTAAGSNAAIDILADPMSNFVGNYRTFKVNYQARDPRANSFIYNPVRNFALSVMFSDNDTPRRLIRHYLIWAPQP